MISMPVVVILGKTRFTQQSLRKEVTAWQTTPVAKMTDMTEK